jgi:hypothetical protein
MNIRNFTLAYGIIFITVGAAGFFSAFRSPYPLTDPALLITANQGYLFGLFPVNILHNLVHVAFGIWGIAVYKSAASSLLYARSVAVIYAIFVIMGLIPELNTVFGLVPLHSHDIWLHLLLAAGAAYFAYAYKT